MCSSDLSYDFCLNHALVKPWVSLTIIAIHEPWKMKTNELMMLESVPFSLSGMQCAGLLSFACLSLTHVLVVVAAKSNILFERNQDWSIGAELWWSEGLNWHSEVGSAQKYRGVGNNVPFDNAFSNFVRIEFLRKAAKAIVLALSRFCTLKWCALEMGLINLPLMLCRWE